MSWSPPRASRSRRPLLRVLPILFLLATPALGAPSPDPSFDPAASAQPAGFEYVSPLPNSTLHPTGTSIAIRPGPVLGAVSRDVRRWSVTGSLSGPHAGTLDLTRDGRTLIFRPEVEFAPGERVRVQVGAGLATAEGVAVPALDYWFGITTGDALALRDIAIRASREGEFGEANATPGRATGLPAATAGPASPGLLDLPLPSDYFPISVITSSLPDTEGGIFLSPFAPDFITAHGRLLITDHRAEPLYFRSWPFFTFDFKRQPNGLLTFFSGNGAYYAMDSTYAVVDSFRCGNGYLADEHEFQLLPNGYSLLMAYDPEPYPMDTVVAGGNPDAIVIGLIIQKLDEDKNVVFQWRSWDHMRVTDLVECVSHLTDAVVDYVHGNAIELDQDDNLLISSRHLNEITKIHRDTGSMIWRLGLHAKNNQFTFLDDPRGFAHQHDIRRQPDGHLTLFDNGNCLPPLASRAVEYEIDEKHRTARLVWEYRRTPDQYAAFMGNQQRHADGSMMIGWGGAPGDPKLTELHPDGSVALELGLASGNRWSYRAFRFPWQTTAFSTDAEVDFGAVPARGRATRSFTVTNHLPAPLTLNQFVSSDPAFSLVSPDSLTLPPGGSGTVQLKFTARQLLGTYGDLYVRAVDDTSLIARVVHLRGFASGTGIDINDVSAFEGEPGDTGAYVFTVQIYPPVSDTIQVDYATVDSSATSVSDYVPTFGTLVVLPGDTLATIRVRVNADAFVEGDEVFHVQLMNPVHASLIRDFGRGTIRNDDGILAVPGGIVDGFGLRPPTPNPARNYAEIGFQLPRSASVSLEVFDVRGRRVADLVRGWRAAGPQSVIWPTAGREAGIYFVRLRAGGLAQTGRIVVLR